MPTKPIFGNCLFATLYLLLRGKVKQIIIASSESPLWPHHYIILNKNGHALHFQHIHPHHKNSFAPWWFEGSYQGIRKSMQEELLKKTKRRILGKIGGKIGFFIFLTIYFVLYIPWCVAWALFPPLWTLFDAFHALKKRFWH